MRQEFQSHNLDDSHIASVVAIISPWLSNLVTNDIGLVYNWLLDTGLEATMLEWVTNMSAPEEDHHKADFIRIVDATMNNVWL